MRNSHGSLARRFSRPPRHESTRPSPVLCTTEFRLKTPQDPYVTSEPFRQVCCMSEIIILTFAKNPHQDIVPSRYWIFGLERGRCWEFRSPPKRNTCTWNIECMWAVRVGGGETHEKLGKPPCEIKVKRGLFQKNKHSQGGTLNNENKKC